MERDWEEPQMDAGVHRYLEMWKLDLATFEQHPCISESIRGSKKKLPQIFESNPDSVLIDYINEFTL